MVVPRKGGGIVVSSFKKQQKNVHKAPNKRPQARNHRPARRR